MISASGSPLSSGQAVSLLGSHLFSSSKQESRILRSNQPGLTMGTSHIKNKKTTTFKKEPNKKSRDLEYNVECEVLFRRFLLLKYIADLARGLPEWIRVTPGVLCLRQAAGMFASREEISKQVIRVL
ncbi:hypothetical protein BIV59_14210 [Bacillus sp. MUM 13]|nr:hypothetical protein BIV59_14210 [Bacillus sp. MUM 13]